MNAACINQRTFEVTDNEQLAGKLVYTSLFSYNAEIEIPHSDRYTITSGGFFGTSIIVMQNGHEVATLRMNWKGQIVITLAGGREFLLKNTGFLHNKFVIENNEAEQLLQFEPCLNWRNMSYNYTIEDHRNTSDRLLVLLGLYAANYYAAAMMGLV